MTTPYAGNPASYPANVTLPDDGDPANAVIFDTPLEQLADRTATLGANMRLKTAVFTANGTWVVPADCTRAIVQMFGGGGGGGGAWVAPTVVNNYNAGGAGGGGSLLVTLPVVLTPGETCTITIGAGGTGHAASNTQHTANSGGDTTFACTAGTLTAKGATGGNGGGSQTTTNYILTPAGTPTPGFRPLSQAFVNSTNNYEVVWSFGPGFGGDGVGGGFVVAGGPIPREGWSSAQGYVGGGAGTRGNDSAGGTRKGGGAGGGGAAGPGGAGGGALHGGDGNDSGAGGNGAAGASATANTGAGGGGGSAAGMGTSGSPTSGAGGDGGSGQLTIIYVAAT